MINPFEIHEITLTLNLTDLDILIRLLKQSNPFGTEEGLVIQIVHELEINRQLILNKK